jgi:hypothetical protein
VGPGGLVIDPHGDTLFIGGPPTAAYSIADGTWLWTSSYTHNGSGIIGLSGDGTRLFVTGSWPNRGITTVAYQTWTSLGLPSDWREDVVDADDYVIGEAPAPIAVEVKLFRRTCNTLRPHQALDERTPRAAYLAVQDGD